MTPMLDLLRATWPAVGLGVLALVAGLLGLRRSSAGQPGAWKFFAAGGAAASLALGQFVGPTVGIWLFAAALAALFVKLVVVVASGNWYAPAAWALGALALLGLGGVTLRPLTEGLNEFGTAAMSAEVAQPWWLLLLLLIPVVIRMSYKSLAGLGPTRRNVAIGLRCLLITLLTFALAELRLRRPNENTSVLFLIDRSLSIPQDVDPNDPTGADRRWARVKRFVTEATAKRPVGRERDQAGVIVFGRRPRLVLPASDVMKLNLEDSILGAVDTTYTDVAAALKLALASFPEGTAKRVVLLSDGNENLGNAVEQARIAAQNGVQIDAVPLAAGYRNENEVLVEKVEAPPVTEQGARLPIRVLVRSYNPRPVTGALALKQTSDGKSLPVAIEAGPGVKERGPPAVVQLRPGLNSFSFKQSLEAAQRSYTYQAVFTPIDSVTERGDLVKGLAGDRMQNNAASTHVVALGQRRVLFIESRNHPEEHRHLIDQLSGKGDTKFQITAVSSATLPINKDDLGVLLSNYDCVVLANVPAEELTEEQQEIIRANTHDQGCGLVMLGGPDSFGAGGYQGTPVEKALPVDCDIKSIKVAGKGGLVLIMHASEADNGNALQKQIAKLSIQKLAPVDMVGMLYYDFNVKWHVPFQTVGGNRGSILRQVDRMQPGDMPDFDPALLMAYNTLNDPRHQLAVKHCIVISDGDPQLNNLTTLTNMKAAGITVSTVGIATHGAPENTKMIKMATMTGGRAHLNPPPQAIPAIYIQETRIVSQSFLFENRFQPKLQAASGPADKLSGTLPALFGFVRTSLKQSPLVEMGIEGPPTLDQRFPILASWQYGLGKAVAFTSDARTAPPRLGWDREWAGSDMYLKFWEQAIGWALRGVETGKLAISSEYKDGKVRVTVDARDEKNRPMTEFRMQGLVTTPNSGGDGKPVELKFEQKNSGQYEAEFKAEEAGSYFINAKAVRSVPQMRNGREVMVEEVDSIRSGVTLPYSPEFADLESNTALLRRLTETTGGELYEEDDASLARVVKDGTVFRKSPNTAQSPQPMWYWLVLLAGIGLFFDVAVRRIAIEPAEATAAAAKYWAKLRGQATASDVVPAYIERLKSRKASVAETFDRGTRRFDAGDAPAEARPLGAADATGTPAARRPAAPPPPPKKPSEETADDMFARLQRAKKKALEGRDPNEPTNP